MILTWFQAQKILNQVTKFCILSWICYVSKQRGIYFTIYKVLWIRSHFQKDWEIIVLVLHVELHFEIMVSIWCKLPCYGHFLVSFITDKSETRFSNTYNVMPWAHASSVNSKNPSEKADRPSSTKFEYAYFLLIVGVMDPLNTSCYVVPLTEHTR